MTDCLTLTVAQAADLIGCGAATVRMLMVHGKLKGYRSDGGRVLRPSLFSILVDVLETPEPVALQFVLRFLEKAECSTPPLSSGPQQHDPESVEPSKPEPRSASTRRRTCADLETEGLDTRRHSRPATTNSAAPSSSPEINPGTAAALRIFERTLNGTQQPAREGSAR